MDISHTDKQPNVRPVTALKAVDTGWTDVRHATQESSAQKERTDKLLKQIRDDVFTGPVVRGAVALREGIEVDLRTRITCDKFIFDKPEEFRRLEPPLYKPRLQERLRALLDTSLQELKTDSSDENSRRVLLELLTNTAKLIEFNITVPQFNTDQDSGVRSLVFGVYHRLARMLGRNTVDAVKADTKAMILSVADRIDHNPGFGRASKISPQEHIDTVVVPLLDEDGKGFAHDTGIYHIPEKPSLMKFYRLLATRHSRSRRVEAP